jgi:hypothetical protein
MPQKTDKVIAPYPPSDGREWENQCARCGSTVAWEDCTACQEGFVDDDDGPILCDTCDGLGGWWMCLSSYEWCQAHPRPGRESVRRGQVEWFVAPSLLER